MTMAGDPIPPAPDTTPRDRWIAIGAVAVLMSLVLRNAWVTEDAYITLRTIEHWVSGYGLRWNIGERVQAYTHPLWMLLMAIPYAIGRDPYTSAMVVSLLVTLAAALALVWIARSSGHAVAAVVLVMLSRAFIDYSTSGLENPLSHLFVALLVWLYAVREAGPLPLALCAAGLGLNRTDTLLVAFAPLAHTTFVALKTRGLKPTLKELAIGFSPYLAWELFSLFYYGFLVPNTAFAKLNTGIPPAELARQGFAYLLNGVAWDPGLAVVLGVGIAVGFARRELRSSLLAASALLYLLYLIRIGGDFMQGRFLTVPVFLAASLVAVSKLPLQQPARVAALLVPALVLAFHPGAQDYDHGNSGIEDEREFYEDALGLTMFTRTGSLPENHIFRNVGNEFHEQAAKIPVRASYNVGIIGYYAGPKVHIVDENALSEPLLGRLPIRHDPSWRIGHYRRAVPDGYIETIRNGKCEMKDEKLCAYYEKLKLIISGPLFSWERLKAIVAMNLGVYEPLLDRDRYRFPGALVEPLDNLRTEIPENSPWNHPASRTLPPDGIDLTLASPSKAKRVSISFDGNDAYDVEFRLGDRTLGSVHSRSQGRGKLRTRKLNTPPEAASQGFDHLVVRPRSGDGMYSLGYVRLEP